MNNKICFDNNIFLLIIFSIIVYTFINRNKKKDNINIPKCPDCNCPVLKEDNRYKPLNDPLHPPTKIYNGLYDYIMPNFLKSRSSRGPLPDYQYIGNAIGKHNSDTSKDDIIIQIFGRQTYRGSNKWEHYGLHTHNNIKYTIDISKELRNNDSISIREHNEYTFIFYENDYNQDIYRYNPHGLNYY